MSDIEAIKRRVEKLLALSKSPNIEEADSALKKANRLMEEHSLSKSECFEIKEERARSVWDDGDWRNLLADCVAWLYNCVKITSKRYASEDAYRRTSYVHFFGKDLQAFMAMKMFVYLTDSIKRMSRSKRGVSQSYIDSYKFGMAMKLMDRIEAMSGKVSWCETRHDEMRAVTAYIKRSAPNLKEVEASSMPPPKIRNKRAWLAGFERGDEISLNRQAEAGERLCIS